MSEQSAARTSFTSFLLQLRDGFQDFLLTDSGLCWDDGKLPDTNNDDLKSSLVMERDAARGLADGCSLQQARQVVAECLDDELRLAHTMSGRSAASELGDPGLFLIGLG